MSLITLAGHAPKIEWKVEPKIQSKIVRLATNKYAEVYPDQVIVKHTTTSAVCGTTAVEFKIDKDQFNKMYLGSLEKNFHTSKLEQDDEHELTSRDINFCDLTGKYHYIDLGKMGSIDLSADIFTNYIVFDHLDGYSLKHKLWLNVGQFNRIVEVAKQQGLITEIIPEVVIQK